MDEQNSVMNDSAMRDAWKAVKGAGAAAFAAKAAPIIAAAVGFPPMAVVAIVGAIAHGLLSLISRKTGWDWL